MVLRLNWVVFSKTILPFLLNIVLHYHLSSFQVVDTEFVENISKYFYVNDLAFTPVSMTAAYILYFKARKRILKEGAFI